MRKINMSHRSKMASSGATPVESAGRPIIASVEIERALRRSKVAFVISLLLLIGSLLVGIVGGGASVPLIQAISYNSSFTSLSERLNHELDIFLLDAAIIFGIGTLVGLSVIVATSIAKSKTGSTFFTRWSTLAAVLVPVVGSVAFIVCVIVRIDPNAM